MEEAAQNNFGTQGEKMTSDIWHSNRLPKLFPNLYQALKTILEKHGIGYREIPGTRDIWCRDYMPVCAADGGMIQFVYRPSYLRKVKEDRHRFTPPSCWDGLTFASRVRESVLFLDGGTVETCGRTGIVTERLFKDNFPFDHEDLTIRFRQLLALDRLIVIPEEPGDVTGHVDGVVRFVDERRVVMNDYALEKELAGYGRKVETILREEGLENLKLPYAPTGEIGADGMPSALGCYINFLRIGDLVILPQFGLKQDAEALAACRRIFGGDIEVETVECSKLASEGGVLNCVSWTDTVV